MPMGQAALVAGGLFLGGIAVFQGLFMGLKRFGTHGASQTAGQGASAVVAAVAGLLLLSAFSLIPAAGESVLKNAVLIAVGYGTFFAAGAVFFKNAMSKAVFLFLTLWGALLFVPESFSPGQVGPFFSIVLRAVLAFFATLFVVMFEKTDRVAGLSVAVTASFAFFFLLLNGLGQAVPVYGACVASLLWIGSLPFNVYAQAYQRLGLSRQSFSLIGFLWGFLFALLALKGFGEAALLATAYYWLEALFVAGCAVWALKTGGACSFMVEKAMAQTDDTRAVLKFVFSRSLILAALGLLSVLSKGAIGWAVYAACVAIVALDMGRRCRVWNQPKVRLRDLVGDMKAGVSALAQEAKTAFAQVKAEREAAGQPVDAPAPTPQKAAPSPQKAISSKKAPSKRPARGGGKQKGHQKRGARP